MTKREIFDKVKTHLLTQKEKAVNKYVEGAPCMYRTPEGLSCAVGCLIPEDLYDKSIEGIAVFSLIHEVDTANRELFNNILTTILGEDSYQDKLGLCNLLQYIHDRVHVQDWAYELDRLEKVLND